MTDLSIIIISYNTKKLLQLCLMTVFSSLEDTVLTYEIIVVDNASEDGSRKLIRDAFPKVRMIENEENVGFGRANNQAAKIAKGEYLLFLNSDIKVLDKGIEKLFRFIKDLEEKKNSFQNISLLNLTNCSQQNFIAGGKLFNPDKSPQPSCGHFYTLPIIFLSLFLKGDKLQITRFSPHKIIDTGWISGACLVVKKDVFNKLGGFDESIFMYMDEVDFCYRAKQRKVRILFYPEAQFIHVGAGSIGNRRKAYANLYKGILYFYRKHWPEKLVYAKAILYIKAFIGLTFGKILYDKSLIEGYRKALKKLREDQN